MTVHLKIPHHIYQKMIIDLARPHSFAFERIGFLRCKIGNRKASAQLILAADYWPVPDDQYVPDEFSGARINSQAIRDALQTAFSTGDGIFHVHMHDFPGIPVFSLMDCEEIPRVVESLTFANPEMPHGMLVLGHDLASANVVMPGGKLQPVDRIAVIGQPTLVISALPEFDGGERFDRQTFLGPLAPQRIHSLKIGIIGLSGGGSHIVQQASHVGFSDFVLFDSQAIDLSNLNRLVGATEKDVAEGRLKIAVANRVVKSINKRARTKPLAARWQDYPEILRTCDIVFGCVDGFDERRQLESACRRYLIPLIDIGMDVAIVRSQKPRVFGQLILSLPGYACMHCIGFLNERTLSVEAQKYGDAGSNPQVVWSNGVLASMAVGVAVDLTAGWNSAPGLIYKSYDGNKNNFTDHPRYEFVRNLKCDHFEFENIGDP